MTTASDKQLHAASALLLRAPMSTSLADSALAAQVQRVRGSLAVRAAAAASGPAPSRARLSTGGTGAGTGASSAPPTPNAASAAKQPTYLAKRPWETTAQQRGAGLVSGDVARRIEEQVTALGLAPIAP